MWVAIAAIFWGGAMLLWETVRRGCAHIKPVLRLVDVLGWALMGLCFDLVMTFQWRAFHWPFILLTLATFVGGAVVGRSSRQKALRKDLDS